MKITMDEAAVKAAGLSEKEYKTMVKLLKREPNELELALIGVMWSEHCSYKSTKKLLARFPQKGARVVQGPGENAGVVDLGEGWGLAFKIESHNHPSAVAPHQGASTGVGGILRDILAMGARPAACLGGLFFGDPALAKTQWLAENIMAGISDYGDAVGVPTIGGQIFYDPTYNDNPLVNAFGAGFVRLESLASAKTASPGDLAILLGSKTDRDGVAGASFASRELDDEAAVETGRPRIPVGDPFKEKQLIDCCLELLGAGLIASMQDMGAAGLLSSSSEVAHKSGAGMDIHCEKVPLRTDEEDMAPWEIFLSETQERMLLVIKTENREAVSAHARRYGLDCAVIGEVTEGDRYRVFKNSQPLADLPVSILGQAPAADWPAKPADDLEERRTNPPAPADLNPAEDILALLASPNGHEGKAVWQRISVLPVPETTRMAVFSLEAEPRKCRTEAFSGAAETMAQSIRGLTLTGAEPLGMTNCLNFPSPEIPENFHELSECVRGLAEVCRDLDCPVVSGNVSLYNETPAGRIHPTPVVVAVGLVKEAEHLLAAGRTRSGDRLFLVGPPAAPLGGSRWQALRLTEPQGGPYAYQPDLEKKFAAKALATARAGLAHSGRVLAGGGLALALALEAIQSGQGLSVILPKGPQAEILFGEGGPRALYAVPAEKDSEFRSLWSGYPLELLGRAEGEALSFSDHFSISLIELSKAFRD